MIVPRWALLAALGAGCVVACAAVALIAVLLLFRTGAALPASEAAEIPTRPAPRRPGSQQGSVTPGETALAQSAGSAATPPEVRRTAQATDAAVPTTSAVNATVSAPATANTRAVTPASESGGTAAPTASGVPSTMPTHTPSPTRTPTLTRTPTPTRTPSPTRTPNSTPLPSAAPSETPPPASGSVRVLFVGYASAAQPNYEHIRIANCDAHDVDLSGWQIKSPQTGHAYRIPGGVVARPGCRPAVQVTLNTHTAGNEDATKNIFSWGQPAAVEEWPNRAGSVQLIDAGGAVEYECAYSPDPNKLEVTCP